MKKLIAIFALAAAPLFSYGQEFPPSQVRIVVPFTPGGGTDVITRLVAQQLAELWKVTVLVENRIGAGGVIGSKWVAEQAPDGRTFLAVASAFGVRLAIDPKVPYSVDKDFTGVGQMAPSPSFLVTSPSFGFKSLQDLVAYAKKQPQGIHYASAGVGSTAHMHAAAVAHLTGLKAEHVAYRGTPEAVNDTMTGRVLYAFAPPPAATPPPRGGAPPVPPTTPHPPPAGPPAAIRERFARDMAKALEMQSVKDRLTTLGATPAFMGSQEWDKFAREYVVRMRKLGQDVGIKPQ